MKNEIIRELHKASEDLTSACGSIDPTIFFHQPAKDKWSIGQHVKHLITATATTRLAYRLPKWFVRIYAGIPTRASRSYEEVVARYQQRLQEGGKAKGRYVPKAVWPKNGRDRLLHDFSQATSLLAKDIDKNWREEQLDRYLAPHPLMGKLTLRELAYFTIYHTRHHLESVKKLTG